MKLWSRLLLLLFAAFIIGIFTWALFVPKDDISHRIYQTLKEQEKRADLVFKGVMFEEVVNGVKYWQLKADSAIVNKTTGLATLSDAKGTFFKRGKPVLSFKSPAALWDMKKKEIFLDKPLGYDVNLERKISALIIDLKKSNFSIFNLPRIYKKGFGYWFQANNLSWKLTDQKLLCTGGIVLNKGEVTGYAERLEGDVALEKIILQGSPRIIIAPNNISPATLEAESFEVVSEENIIYAKGQPVIFWEDAKISSNNIKYLQKDGALILNDNVKIDYKDIQAWGNSATYQTEAGNIVIEGDAQANQGTNALSGEKVNVSLKNKKISVLGKGKVVITEEELK
ncbi:MAG: LptA/OstA family protein [Candidatus Margulisbacteria bacterium]|nr:LptA/OstA family protein [Candidatus Margulisiibacteriota bacterium]